MKQYFYTTVSALALFFVSCFPYASNAQCMCSATVAPHTVTQSFSLAPSYSQTFDIPFDQFDKTLGNLMCVVLKDSIVAVSTTHVHNQAPQDIEYKFRLTASLNIGAPGISQSDAYDKFYGPDSLKAAGTGRDSIVYGPDSIINSVVYVSTSYNPGAYYSGTDPVVHFAISGGLVSLKGGLTFGQNIATLTSGYFELTYYYCDFGALSTSIRNFMTVKDGNSIKIQWITDNSASTNNYEIEISEDAHTFKTLGQPAGTHAAESATTKYDYQYALDPAAAGRLYFRIKQTDANGKVSYSNIRAIMLGEGQLASFSTYPNPATDRITLQFDRLFRGDYSVDILNMTGQKIYSRLVKLNNSNTIQLQLPRAPMAGVYFVRARDLSSNQVYTKKVLFSPER